MAATTSTAGALGAFCGSARSDVYSFFCLCVTRDAPGIWLVGFVCVFGAQVSDVMFFTHRSVCSCLVVVWGFMMYTLSISLFNKI
jgi:hypothetical protein